MLNILALDLLLALTPLKRNSASHITQNVQHHETVRYRHGLLLGCN